MVALWPRPLPAWYWRYQIWRDGGKKGPRPPGVPQRIPVWAHTRYLIHRGVKPKPQTQPSRLLVGFLRDASHADAGTPKGAAFIQAGGDRILIQFRDPVNDQSNRDRLPVWAAEWRRAGVAVDGWWRVNQSPSNTPPAVVGVDGWWPNAEDPAEIARLPEIYRQGCAGVATLGKAPGAWPPAGGLLAAECFREGPTSDHNVLNSVRFWQAAGLPLDQLIVVIQGYGTPFAPPVEQARQAVSLGVRKLGLYPLDGFTPADIAAIGGMV